MKHEIAIKNTAFEILEYKQKFYISANIRQICNLPAMMPSMEHNKRTYFELTEVIGYSFSDTDRTTYTLLLESYAKVAAPELNENEPSVYEKLKKECFGVG